MLTQHEIDRLVDDTCIVKINLKMTESDYITSMIGDLERRMFEVNPKLKIIWKSYRDFVHDILNSGLDLFSPRKNGEERFNFTNEYCRYIDRCANKIYTLEEHYKTHQETIDLTNI